ncbi:MAG: rhodanese-like domain-containing protein [Candidatus Levybacteria bacterium]|nr:rhodanese-like domain-containing protein [Candidatus Levybacteria bacterium]
MKHISADSVFAALSAQEPITLLDVRTEMEHKKAHIAGSTHITLGEVKEKVAKRIPKKDATVYVYCLSGSRSELIVPFLEQIGYTDVYSMDHGLLAWRAKGYPLVSD